MIANDKYVLNEVSLVMGSINHVRGAVLANDYWHRVVVKNVHGQSRDDVLQSLMDAIYPIDLVPVNYECSKDGVASFLLKNCGEAIMILWRKNLVVPHYDHKKNIYFQTNIILKEISCKDLRVDLQSAIVNVLKRRYVEKIKVLNLEEFHRDPDLIHYTPLSQPRLLNYIFHLCNEFEIEHLILKNNRLRGLKSFEVLLRGKSGRTLRILDLRNNKIGSIDEVRNLKHFPIQEIFLEENPLCNDMKDYEYMSTVKLIFPDIKCLDGLPVGINSTIPLKRNYLCDNSAREFVDKFMEHYFNLLDGVKDRILLKDLYHENAVFTLTSRLLHGQKSSLGTKLADFQKYGHNITSGFYSRLHDMVFIGPEKIVRLIMSLPLSLHDPATFTVDLTYSKDNVSIITITGVFKNESESVLEVEQLYSFMRTFVVKKNPNTCEHQIINEILNVTNITSLSQRGAFKFETFRDMNRYIRVHLPTNDEEKEAILNTLMLITNLKLVWAKKCLIECDFNLKRSLVLFVDLLKANKFPCEAFSNYIPKKIYIPVEIPHQLPAPPKPIETVQIEKDDDNDEGVEEKILEPFSNLIKMGFTTTVVNPNDPNVVVINRPANKSLKKGLRFFGPDGQTIVIQSGHKQSVPYRLFSRGKGVEKEKNPEPQFSVPVNQSVPTPSVSSAETQRIEIVPKSPAKINVLSNICINNQSNKVKNNPWNPSKLQDSTNTIKTNLELDNSTHTITTNLELDDSTNTIQTNLELDDSNNTIKTNQELDDSIHSQENTTQSNVSSEERKEFELVAIEVEDEDSDDEDSAENKILPTKASTISLKNSDLFDDCNLVKEILTNCPKSIKDVLCIPINNPYLETDRCIGRAIYQLRRDYRKVFWYYKLLMNQIYCLDFEIRSKDLMKAAMRWLNKEERDVFKEMCILFDIKYKPEILRKRMFDRLFVERTSANTINVLMREGHRIGHKYLRDILIHMTNTYLPKDKLCLVYTALHDLQYTHGNKPDEEIMDILTRKAGFAENCKIEGLIYKEIPEPEKVPPMNVTPEMYKDFRKFRNNVLKLVGVHAYEYVAKKIREFVTFQAQPKVVIERGNAYLRKYHNRFTVIKILVEKYWAIKEYGQIKLVFDNQLEKGNAEMLRLINILRLIYNIKYDIEFGATDNREQTQIFINTSTMPDLLNFLEDLANEHDNRISLVFDYILNDPAVEQNRKIFIAYAYKVYSLKLKDEEISLKAETFYKQYNGGYEAFHYEATLQTLVKMSIPFDITGKYYGIDIVKALMERYLAQYKYSFMVGLHVIWIYYLKKLTTEARSVRKRCLDVLKQESEELYFKFSLISAILEANHGDHNVAINGLKVLENQYKNNMNYICTLVECHIQHGNLEKARNILLPFLKDAAYIMDPEIQKTVFIYSINWDIKLNGSTITRLLNPPSKRKFDDPPYLWN